MIATQAEREHSDFIYPTRSEKFVTKIQESFDIMFEEEIRDLWDSSSIWDTVYGGSDGVLNNWNGTLADLADHISRWGFLTSCLGTEASRLRRASHPRVLWATPTHRAADI